MYSLMVMAVLNCFGVKNDDVRVKWYIVVDDYNDMLIVVNLIVYYFDWGVNSLSDLSLVYFVVCCQTVVVVVDCYWAVDEYAEIHHQIDIRRD